MNLFGFISSSIGNLICKTMAGKGFYMNAVIMSKTIIIRVEATVKPTRKYFGLYLSGGPVVATTLAGENLRVLSQNGTN